MTRDEVIKLAREAADPETADPLHRDMVTLVVWELERFAALIAAGAADRARQDYEREHCRHVVPLPDALRVMIDDAVAAEREACAKVCDGIDEACFPTSRGPAAKCAQAIRARGSA